MTNEQQHHGEHLLSLLRTTERIVAETSVAEFLDWLYAHGPALDEVPREWVLEAYAAYRREDEAA